MPSFDELGLSRNLLDAVNLLEYVEPTPVQQKTIPAILAGKDVVAGAKTGTGKTAAFCLPCMDMFKKGKKGAAPRLLIVTPTRELAQQISEVAETIAACTKHRVLSVVGGVSMKPQIQKLKSGVEVLIATPGRLLDLYNQGYVDLSYVRFFVLDEADRMLDMGFAPDIYKIAEHLPKERQTMLFSATIDDAVEKSINTLMHDPEIVEIARRGEVADAVEQHIIRIPHTLKSSLLSALLREKGSSRVIVFCRTRGRADTCARRLNRDGITAAAIHSDRTQNQRMRALRDFDRGTIDVIVATDVLARGIDVEKVAYVVNFDLPMQPEDYVHRIGRTGRAGSSGEAISFVSPENEKMLKEIQKLTKQKIPEMVVESFDRGAAEEKAATTAMRATSQRDPEIAAAVKEAKAKEKRKARAKARAAEAAQTPAQRRRKPQLKEVEVKEAVQVQAESKPKEAVQEQASPSVPKKGASKRKPAPKKNNTRKATPANSYYSDITVKKNGGKTSSRSTSKRPSSKSPARKTSSSNGSFKRKKVTRNRPSR